MDILLLRLEAPLMAFGGPIVDNYGIIQPFPAASMLTGLIGNALGWEHKDGAALNMLQSRLRFAARIDRPGQEITDYQTVDLGQDFMLGTGWTTWGEREGRAGGAKQTGTHIRYRHYRADTCTIVTLSLHPADESPTLNTVERALIEPSRPLFLGRKTCIPASPLLLGRTTATSLIEALRTVPMNGAVCVQAQWPAAEEGPAPNRLIAVTDERDWVNQVHCGERFVRHGDLVLEANHDAHDTDVL